MNFNLSEKNLYSIGRNLFFIGTFLLPSAFGLSVIIYLASLILSPNLRKNYFSDKLNLILFCSSIFLIISSLNTTINENIDSINSQEFLDLWIGLFNWIPYFLCFWGFQPYLINTNLRKKFSLLLISGSLPILIIGLAQHFFDLKGPFEIFNGLIIWYSKPIHTGVTSIFSNPNYAGSWLMLIFPFSLASYLVAIRNKRNIYISGIFLILIVLITYLTYSRNAWGALLISIPLMTGIRILIWYLPLIFISTSAIFFASNSADFLGLRNLFRNIVPNNIWKEFTPMEYVSSHQSRLEIWSNSISLIKESPLLGWGKNKFQIVYEEIYSKFVYHAHNLILEIAFNYGLIFAFIIASFFIFILFNSYKTIFKRKNNFDLFEKAWWVSGFVFFLTQMLDVQYYDGRIALTFWLLLSGLRTQQKQSKEKLIR